MMLPMLYKERDEAIKEFNTWIAELDSNKVKTGRVSLNELLDEFGLDNFDKVISLFLTWWRLEGENWFAEKYGKTVRVESKFAEDGNKYLTWNEMVQAEKDLLEDKDYGINPDDVTVDNMTVEDTIEDTVITMKENNDENNIDGGANKAHSKPASLPASLPASFFTDDDDFDF